MLYSLGGGSYFGITRNGQVINLNVKVDYDIQKRYLEGKKVDCNNLEMVVKEMSRKKDENNIRNFVKLFILYFFYCILFNNTNNGYPKALLALVNDLPSLRYYNWPDVVDQLIINSLRFAVKDCRII